MKRFFLTGLMLACLAVASPGWAQSFHQDQSEESPGNNSQGNKEKGKTSSQGKVITNDNLSATKASGDEAPAAGRAVAKEFPSVSLPGKSWAVEIRAAGFTLDPDQSSPGGKRRIMANNPTTGVIISVQLEQVDHVPDLDECRQYQRNRIKDFAGKYDLQDVKYWDDGRMAFVEYFIPAIQGAPIRQKNLFACFSRENVFVDVHISKSLYETKDELSLRAVMGTVYVAAANGGTASDSSPNSMDLFEQGSRLFLQNKFREAIDPYQKALDLEKSDPRLEKNLWRVLVDNLGMAYGITGDLREARATFEFGLSQDNSYPLFYYNLACAYAEMDDMDDTISNLKTAFTYKENVIAGESMPDPRQDDSFQRFMKNEKFRKLADSLMNSPK